RGVAQRGADRDAGPLVGGRSRRTARGDRAREGGCSRPARGSQPAHLGISPPMRLFDQLNPYRLRPGTAADACSDGSGRKDVGEFADEAGCRTIPGVTHVPVVALYVGRVQPAAIRHRWAAQRQYGEARDVVPRALATAMGGWGTTEFSRDRDLREVR